MLKIKIKLRNVVAIAACLAVITMIVSCEKEKETEKEFKLKLLDTETFDQYQMRKFIYDDHNRIKEIWAFFEEILYEKCILTYIGGDLTKLEHEYLVEDKLVVVGTRHYIKNGNTISWSDDVEIIEGEGEGIQNFKSTITLNNNGFPEKIEEVLFNITSVSYFIYINGNLTKYSYDTVFSSNNNDPGERNYTYSTNKSALSGCKTPKWFMFLYYKEMASHNAVTTSSYPAASTYSYEFDSDGFPTKCKQTYYGIEYITEFKYKN